MTISEEKPLYKSVDYKLIYSKANELLASTNEINSFPFKVRPFIKEQSDIRICSFKKAFEKYGLNVRDFGSESSVWIEFNGRNIIFYNQDEPAYRVRFDIIHEFAHYYLGHDTNLKRTDSLYGIQEISANCFAAQILMPEQLLRECTRRGYVLSVDFIVRSFGVSRESAGKRLKTLSRTIYEWHSYKETKFDDVILGRYTPFLDMIAPDSDPVYDFEQELERQQSRELWMNFR